MNIDLLAQDSNIVVNKKLMELLGIEQAVYVSEILNICKKAAAKKSFDPATGFIKIDRKYIEKQTTLKTAKQYEFDAALSALEVVAVDPENLDRIAVNTNKIVALIIGNIESITAVKVAAKSDKEAKKEAKTAGIISNLKRAIETTNTVVRQKIELWIEATYGKTHTQAQVRAFESKLNSLGISEEAKASVVEICTLSGYVDPAWGFERYSKQTASNATRLGGTQKISTGLDTTHQF